MHPSDVTQSSIVLIHPYPPNRGVKDIVAPNKLYMFTWIFFLGRTFVRSTLLHLVSSLQPSIYFILSGRSPVFNSSGSHLTQKQRNIVMASESSPSACLLSCQENLGNRVIVLDRSSVKPRLV